MTAMMELSPMTELTAGELDAVAGGQAHAIATGLVAVGAAIGDIVVSAINNNNVTLTNIANNNDELRLRSSAAPARSAF
jgi:hypothetical protein